MGPTAGLAQPVAIRPAVLSDLQDVLHVRRAQEHADNGERYTTAERLTAEWEALGPRLGTGVWVAMDANGRLIASAELAREGQEFMARLWILPDSRNSGIEMSLLARAEQRAGTIGREEGAHSIKLFTQLTSSTSAVRQALEQAGFVATSTYEKMEFPLKEPPAIPQAIAGITIRPCVLGQDEAVVYRADEEAFQDQRGHTSRTFDQWRRRLNMREETDEPSVWLVAWDADEVAGTALGEVIKGTGWIHHLSVRRPWRHRGLGAALTLAALGAFYRLGIRAVRLNVDAQSLTNAHKLYRRLGFRVAGTYSNHEKIVALE